MTTTVEPVYLKTFRNGGLAKKRDAALAMLEHCTLCPRCCRVDRNSGETGVCRTGRYALVASAGPHFGEESPLVGTHGSGTIFFTHCNLKCIFCQNFDISHQGVGEVISPENLARVMINLQDTGCHNINLFTPSHVVPQILEALVIAVEAGLRVPIVYNSGGYDSLPTLRLLEGIIDIYMPDFKFWDAAIAKAACGAEDYPEVVKSALIEMHRQVGDLVIDENGLAVRGLLVRHLVLPENLAGTRRVMRYIARNISKNTYVNIMSQYRPEGRAREIPGLSKPLKPSEYRKALAEARAEGIERMDMG